jgi:hypothetical protein
MCIHVTKCVSNFHKGNSKRYLKDNKSVHDKNIHGPPVMAIQSRHPASQRASLPPSYIKNMMILEVKKSPRRFYVLSHTCVSAQ